MRFEDFKKMKQADRIEYLLLKESNPTLVTVSFVYAFFILAILLLILGWVIYNGTGSIFVLRYFNYMLDKIGLLGFIACIIIDILMQISHSRRKQRIDDDFYRRIKK